MRTPMMGTTRHTHQRRTFLISSGVGVVTCHHDMRLGLRRPLGHSPGPGARVLVMILPGQQVALPWRPLLLTVAKRWHSVRMTALHSKNRNSQRMQEHGKGPQGRVACMGCHHRSRQQGLPHTGTRRRPSGPKTTLHVRGKDEPQTLMKPWPDRMGTTARDMRELLKPR